jgi:hypothetical protein
MAGDKPVLRIGLVSSGFMGKTHVFGFASAPQVFDLPCKIGPSKYSAEASA